jgi:hypothetical protein
MALLAAVLTIYAPRTVLAQDFWDGCPPDFSYQAQSGSSLYVQPSDVHIGRPGCPWLIADVTNAQGKWMMLGGQWAGFSPSSLAQCNGARYDYVVARPVGGYGYVVIGSDSLVGQWGNWFGSEFCYFKPTSGQAVTSIYNSPYNDYRLLMRSFEPDGTERMAAGLIQADPRLIE